LEPNLAPHVSEAIRSATQVDVEHHEQATFTQLWVDRVIAFLSQPRFLVLASLGIFGWISGNVLTTALGYRTIDPAPFDWLGSVVALGEFYVVVMILITQRREEQLAQHHAQLTLQLTLLSEQKTAKIIALLEELRRDSPQIPNRVDRQAAAMAEAADPQQLLGALKDAKATAIDDAAHNAADARRKS
jgi:uncharacterized membrane protein